MAEIRDFPVAGGLSDTAANGAWPEGMSYSSVNDSGRENQNILGRWYKNTNGSLVSTGTGPSIEVTPLTKSGTTYDTPTSKGIACPCASTWRWLRMR